MRLWYDKTGKLTIAEYVAKREKAYRARNPQSRPEFTRVPGDPENRGPKTIFPSFKQTESSQGHWYSSEYYLAAKARKMALKKCEAEGKTEGAE